MVVELYPHQLEAVEKMRNGSVLTGGVGTGKSITSLWYWYTKVCNGIPPGQKDSKPMFDPTDLYVITTARKRDFLEWDKDAIALGVGRNENAGGAHFTVDSWNNIGAYESVENAFFIFDEQRLVGSGAWVKSFIKIASKNRWILLSATPGDTWMDYVPVFIAHGFFKNRTEFIREHVVYNNFSKFPKVDRYISTKKLESYRDSILVDMPYQRHTTRHLQNVDAEWDETLLKRVLKDRWHVYEDRPIRNVSELFLVARRVVNSDVSRLGSILRLMEKHKRLIVFYNFDYELDILRTIGVTTGVPMAEWNGHRHEDIPDSSRWVYLVQYTAGNEGWNCTTTDAMAFYSLNYSYKVFHQAQGRIDRLNTPFKDLYYYILRSGSVIDQGIWRSIKVKEKFNEKSFAKQLHIEEFENKKMEVAINNQPMALMCGVTAEHKPHIWDDVHGEHQCFGGPFSSLQVRIMEARAA